MICLWVSNNQACGFSNIKRGADMPRKGLTMRQIRELLRLKTCEPQLGDRVLALGLGVARSTAQDCLKRLVTAGNFVSAAGTAAFAAEAAVAGKTAFAVAAPAAEVAGIAFAAVEWTASTVRPLLAQAGVAGIAFAAAHSASPALPPQLPHSLALQSASAKHRLAALRQVVHSSLQLESEMKRQEVQPPGLLAGFKAPAPGFLLLVASRPSSV